MNLIEELSSALREVKLIDSFERVRQHYDEPKFWFYSASISDKHLVHDGSHFHSQASGVSFFDQKSAVLKALVEAIERYSNFAFFKEDISRVGSYSSLAKSAIDPVKFVYFTDSQLNQDDYKKFRINDKSYFRWTDIKLLGGSKNYLVPCQAIYLSYQPVKREPVIYPSISTGSAGHTTLPSAILGGIYEVIERDSFMIYYLNKLKPRRFSLESSRNKKIHALFEISERYHLKIFSLDITTDLGIPSVASIVVDRSGLSKSISVGLKSHLDTETAIIGSIHEAFHTRTWIREDFIKNSNIVTESELIEDSSLKNRGLFWYSPDTIKKLDFFLNDLELQKIRQVEYKRPVKEQIQLLKNILNRKGYEIYYKDITSRYFKDIPIKVVKVIIPGMQPVYLNEKYPLLGGLRLQTVPGDLGYKRKRTINTYPHPFL